MARIVCTKCGANYTDETPEGQFSARLFATASNPVGSYLTVAELIATGEDLLQCPRDISKDLEDAINGPGTKFRPEDRKIPGN